VAAARKASQYFRSAICQQGNTPPPSPNRRHLYHAEPLHASPCRRAGGFPEAPAPTPPPCVFRSPALFSARSRHTRRGQIECGGSAGLSSTFQRHGTQHLLHYWSPSSFHLVLVCRQLQRAYYLDFARARAHRGVPSGFVQRTGCSACGLGYPHQVWWAPPMYIARAWAR
jgi:hypothetical protein